MRIQSKFSAGLWLAVLSSVTSPILASAQAPQIAPRITQAIDETKLTTLRGNTHPLARPEFDRGAAPASMPARRMMLVLQRSSQQESALETLLEQQLDASSPNFHQWLTPQQLGQQFGPSDQDVQTITSWLQSHGFEVAGVSNGRTVIEFSGTVGQVQEAFHTRIHQYHVNGSDYWANSSDPQIPAALTPVVAGIDTLYNFPRNTMHHVGGEISLSKKMGKFEAASPSLMTFGGLQCGVQNACYGMSPYDFAKIYNVAPLWSGSPTPIDGTGITIAVVGESDVNIQDIRNFRNIFALPASDPQIIVDGPDPGTVKGDETESDLDLEWTGGVAKGATIDFVISATTSTSLGVDLSAQYVVDNNLAPVLSESYGICELFLGAAGNQFYNQLWQQAAAQGITALVATGDSGSAVCDRNADTQGPAQFGLSVSGFSSTPYNIAVGGTDFNDLTNASTYWSATNSVPPGAPAGTPATVSALSYIPETTWNNTCTNAVFGNLLGFSQNAETNCNNPQIESKGFDVPSGGSGGKSNCIDGDGTNPSSCAQGYPKPAWQNAFTPNDGARDVPDVSMMAGVGSPSGAFYLICAADITSGGYTSCQASDPNTHYIAIGGTSASTPVFAGIMALVNQATGSRLGNAANVLYKLAAQPGNSCNSSNGAGTNCVFYDTTNGTIAMPCAKGSPNCNVSNQSDSVGVLTGYTTTSGYDLATGLGSVNANNLVTKWKNFSLTPSSTTLTLNAGNPVNITHGQSVNVSIGVTGTGGTPSGNASLIANEEPNGAAGTDGVQGYTLNAGAASGSTNSLPGGSYGVFAQYAGDGTFASSQSSTTAVTVNPEASKIQIEYRIFDPSTGALTNSNATNVTFGAPSALRVNVTSQAGDACPNNAPGDSACPTGNILLMDNQSTLGPNGGDFPLNAQGYAEDSAIDLPGGVHNLAATYSGDNSFSVPSPNPTTETVTITPVATTTTITSFPTTITTSGTVNLTATINAQNIFSTILPTGTVTFYSGTTEVATAAGGDEYVDPTTHEAVFVTSTNEISLPHGQDSITGRYSGDASYAASTSAPIDVSVLYATATTVMSSNASVPRGTSVTFTAQVTTGQPSPPAFTGTVQFLSDAVSLGAPVGVSGAGQAQVSTSSLSGGTHTITAEYSGDSNFAASTGSTTQTVLLIGTTTSVSSSSNTISQGSNVTFTATVTPTQNGGPTMTGTVQFESNGSNIGSAVNVSNGQAQVQTTTLPVGSDQITAVYSGDSNYSGSTSSAITETVNGAPSFTISANPTTIPVTAPGGSGSSVFTFTGQNGFSSGGNVAISASTSGLPFGANCGFTSGTINIPTNGTAMATYSCTTTAGSSAIPASSNRPGVFGPRTAVWVLALAYIFALGLLAFGQRKGQLRWAGLAAFALFLIVADASCGGGSGGGGGGGNQGTPIADTQMTVMVTINNVSENVTVFLNVE